MKKKLKLILACILFSTSLVFAQTSIKGRVIDEQGEAVIGASVLVKNNSSIGVVTDIDGYFTIKTSINTVLIVSYVGMKTQEVKAQQNLIITLKEDTEMLGEVVVTGYQEVKKDRMTGSVSAIHSGDIKNLNVTSMDQALSGSISGLTSIQSGRPGENARINIRGINSLTGSSDPIWIVDGMPLQGETPDLSATGGGLDATLFMSGIGNISPDNIESITVLKDAAACAIYGARAANGVIVVKTKSGKVGKPTYNVTAHFGITSRPQNNIRMMNSAEKIQFEKEVFNDVNADRGRVGYILRKVERGVLSQAQADARINELSRTNTDWFDELYRQSMSTQISASMSGGTERTQYYTSLNYLSEDGTEYNNNYKRFVFNSKLKHQFHPKLQIETGISATYIGNRNSAANFSTLEYALFANPYESPNGYDQSWVMSLSSLHDGFRWTTFNAKNEIMNNTSTARHLATSLTARIDWKIMDGLSFTSQGVWGLNANNTRTEQGAGTYTNYMSNWLNFLPDELVVSAAKGSLNEGTSYSNSYTWRNMLQFNKEINDTHFIDVMMGQEISDRISYASSNYSPIYDEEHRIVGFPTLPKGIDLKKIDFDGLGSTARFQSKLSSFFLNASYSFKDRYVVSGSVRYDGSDIIGNDNQFTPLWNVSGRWNLHNEPFFNSSFIDELSLRTGYGYTGSIDKKAFPFVVMRLTSNKEYDNQIIPGNFTYANPNVKWQTKRDFNIGLQTSMLNRRITLGVSWYNNFIFDLLDRKSLPLSSGRASVIENVANIVNKGLEVDFGVEIIRKNNFSWNVSGNLAINKSEILETYYKNLEVLPSVSQTTSGSNYFVEGYPVSSWYGYHFAEVDPTTGHTLVYDADGKKFDMDLLNNVTLGLKAPTPSFLGDFFPPITGGIASRVNYKRWVFSTNFQFSGGNYIKSFNTFRVLSDGNRYFADQGRWRAPGDIAPIPAITDYKPAYSKYMYDVMLEKGDYLRNTYTSLGYNMPSSLLEKFGLSSARITFTAYNLFTLTKYKGIDPALMGRIGYPNSRKYSLSFNIGF